MDARTARGRSGRGSKGFLGPVKAERRTPPGRVLLGIARALGASVNWLLSGDAEGEVAEPARPVEIPPELAELAVANGSSARKVFQLVRARSDLLARRSDKARRLLFTKKEWLEFLSRNRAVP